MTLRGSLTTHRIETLVGTPVHRVLDLLRFSSIYWFYYRELKESIRGLRSSEFHCRRISPALEQRVNSDVGRGTEGLWEGGPKAGSLRSTRGQLPRDWHFVLQQ